MPEQGLMSIADILALDATGDLLTWQGHSPARGHAWVFGGQLVAQALAASVNTVASDRRLHSVHAYFLHRGDTTTPIDYQVDPLRDGNSFSSRAVTARQFDKRILHATASFQRPRAGLEHQVPQMSAPPAESLPSTLELAERGDEDYRRWYDTVESRFPLDMRFVGPPPRLSRPVGPDGATNVRFWVRTADPLPADPNVHACAASYISDLFLLSSSLIPHRDVLGDTPLTAMSLDHAMWFHADLCADDWLLYDQEAHWTGGGRGLSRGNFYSPDGRLVASAVQEGLIGITETR
jgi:acyl-CoA thioesterase II